MKKTLSLVLMLNMSILIAASSIIPQDPKISFGKKCMVNSDGSMVSSYVWIHSDSNLTATKELCQELNYVSATK